MSNCMGHMEHIITMFRTLFEFKIFNEISMKNAIFWVNERAPVFVRVFFSLSLSAGLQIIQLNFFLADIQVHCLHLLILPGGYSLCFGRV